MKYSIPEGNMWIERQNRFIHILFICSIALTISTTNIGYAQEGQGVVIDQTIVATAKVTDTALIRKIIEISLIPDTPDSVKALVFIDAGNDGFDSGDFVLVQPSGKSYSLMASADLKEIMKDWQFSAGTQLVGGPEQTADYFEDIQETNPQKKATNFIVAGLLRSLETNYAGREMNILFSRSDDGAYKVDLWGYDDARDKLKWQEPKYRMGGYIDKYDVLQVHRKDSTTVYDSSKLYDQIYIYHNVIDTVFMAPDSIIGKAKPHDTAFQPGLIQPVTKQRRDKKDK